MKKKIFSIVFIAAIAVAAAWNFAQNKSNVELSDLAMVNVEALADGETIKGCCPSGGGCNFYGILMVNVYPCEV